MCFCISTAEPSLLGAVALLHDAERGVDAFRRSPGPPEVDTGRADVAGAGAACVAADADADAADAVFAAEPGDTPTPQAVGGGQAHVLGGCRRLHARQDAVRALEASPPAHQDARCGGAAARLGEAAETAHVTPAHAHARGNRRNSRSKPL